MSPIDVVRAVDGVVVEDVDIATNAGYFAPLASGGESPDGPVPDALAVTTSPSDHCVME